MFGLVYSIASYLGFLGVFGYFAWFSAGLYVPKHVDSGATTGVGWALVVNLSLILLFGLQHSIMAREGFKRGLTRVIPRYAERATFVLVSSLALSALMWLWQPMPTVLWSVNATALAAALWTINALGWLGVPIASFMIDHFDLFGVKQAFYNFRRASFERSGFVTPMLYKYVRHPMMSALLVGLWVTPHMTAGHLLLALGMSAYILIGVHFEEQSLARELGRPYWRYQTSTPKFLPLGGAKTPLDDVPESSPTSSRAG